MNRRAYLLGVAMVMLGNLVAVALRAYAESVFLAAYGPARLPWLFIASALGFAVATLGYHAVTRGGRTRIVDLALLGVLGIAAGVAPMLLDAGITPVIVVVTLAAASQVAGLALWNRIAASVAGREARRALPRAGAAVTAGGVIAGLGAGVLIPRVGLAAIPYLGAAVTIVVLAISLAQERALVSGGAPGATAPAGASSALGEVQRSLLRGLIAVAILEAIVSTVADLQFASALKERYSDVERPVAIALFLGGTNAILLLLQVTAVPRLLVTRSLPFTATIHPAFVIAWYGVVASVAGFVPVAGVRTSDQVLRLATSRTSQELALSALPPAPRARWKVLLRGAVWPAGAALAAFALLLAGPEVLAHFAKLAAVAIVIALVWAVVARIAATRFQRALAAPLGIRVARKVIDARRIDLETLGRWTAAAGSDDPRVAELARAALAVARVDASDLADHLSHEDAAVRAAMLDQLARAPVPALRAELRAMIAIEDDDRALALAIKALAMAGDDAGIERGRSRASLSREVSDAVDAATLALRGGDVLAALPGLCERDPAWAAAILRSRVDLLSEPALATRLLALADAPSPPRAGALFVIARLGPPGALSALDAALVAGTPDARRAIAELDVEGASCLAGNLGALSPRGRLAIARAMSAALSAGALVEALLADRDPEVAHATLRSALAFARGGGVLAAPPIEQAYDVALAALRAHLDARDAEASWSPFARAELAHATSRCVARLMWAGAVEAAAAGRDPGPLAATARHLSTGGEAERRRALDVAQELQTGRSEILAVIERWLRAPVAVTAAVDASATARSSLALASAATSAIATLRAHDPWLASLCAGALADLEPTLSALRRRALFASVAGPALAELAARASRRVLEGELFALGDTGDAMYLVISGSLVASRPRTPDRVISAGGVVGELAVLSHAARAASVRADAGGAEILAIDRAAFSAAAQRAPELLRGLAATLASWLAPNRPDVL